MSNGSGLTNHYRDPFFHEWPTLEAVLEDGFPVDSKMNVNDLMLDFGRNLILRKLGYDINVQLKNSILLKEINKQTKLFNFV